MTNEVNRIIEDFIAMTVLVGNDFVPHNPTIDVQMYGIDLLIQAYQYAKSHMVTMSSDLYLIQPNNSKLNLLMWKHLFQYLSNEEAERAREKEVKYNRNKGPKFEGTGIVYELLHNLHHNIPREKSIGFEKKGWVQAYYRDELNIPVMYQNNELHPNLKFVCRELLNSIGFVHSYYTRGCVDYHWYYPSNYSQKKHYTIRKNLQTKNQKMNPCP